MHGLWLAAFILQWALLILLVVVLAGILRYLSALPHDAASPPTEASNLAVGEIIPSFVLPNHRGQTVASKALLSRASRTVLLFVSPGCPACEV
ncbi:MAG: hypothetical protein ACRDFX_13125, partial [Chloroflexota bacterium]